MFLDGGANVTGGSEQENRRVGLLDDEHGVTSMFGFTKFCCYLLFPYHTQTIHTQVRTPPPPIAFSSSRFFFRGTGELVVSNSDSAEDLCPGLATLGDRCVTPKRKHTVYSVISVSVYFVNLDCL